MPLQNRVTPFGEIVALPGRGTLMGNRGVLHDDDRVVVRRAQVRRWIACRTEFRNRHRTVMTPRRYTELFFLDEAAAFSAGHRPCAECRNADYKRFRSLWEECFGGVAGADAIDARLERERALDGAKRTFRERTASLPDGTYIVLDGFGWLIWKNELLRWTESGYTERRKRQAAGEVEVLTPASFVSLFRAGYTPNVHPSANARPTIPATCG